MEHRAAEMQLGTQAVAVVAAPRQHQCLPPPPLPPPAEPATPPAVAQSNVERRAAVVLVFLEPPAPLAHSHVNPHAPTVPSATRTPPVI